ncbi:lipopolysaccharide heptosyltransferase II [candidate division TA06 bacterium]|uniref:lipopolysaccharide heptosyltransferase II n=1 Tax=candidate division TA06 bacterium TaxID=2250710 RepID=A0A523XRR3_UNCT6|nr:MAG: lipopolysaccharide heptosyltransferase II [candidate division TA06 bacterium]
MDLRNIMVRSPNWIGDFVLSIPALKGLESLFPHAKLTVVAHRRVKDIAEMVEGVDRVVVFDKEGADRSIKNLIRFSRGISEEPIDLSVIFPLSFSSALMGYFSGARRRLGYSTKMRGFLLTDKIRLPLEYRERHLSQTYTNLVAKLGVSDELSTPELNVPEVCEKADRIMESLGYGENRKVVGMAPHATYGPAKRWPMENYSSLAKNLLKRYNCSIVLFGSADDSTLNLEDTTLPDGVVDLCGKLTLTEAAYLLKRCVCLVSNDTGIAHVAAGVGTPVVSIFGSTSPEWTSPIGNKNVVVYEKVECSPCFDRVCRFGHYGCLQNVGTDVVLDAVEEVLR